MDVPKSLPPSAPAAHVPPLTSSNEGGEPYTRRADIEATILQVLRQPPTEWVGMATATGKGRLPSEVLVFLARTLKNGNLQVFGWLIAELCRRLARIAKPLAQGFDSGTTFEIVCRVESEVVALLLAENPSRQSEFLEIAFNQAVQRRTINVVEKYQHRPAILSYLRAEASDEDDESESLVERVKDERPGPEDIVSQLEDAARRPELLRLAFAAVQDHRHVEALILRYVRGWPITDKDPTKPSLARHFKMSERQIRNWIRNGLEAMRAAIGDKR